MKVHRSAAAVLMMAAALAGCDSDDDPTGLVIADFQGSWEAETLAFTPTDEESESNPVPFIAAGGALEVTIGSTGNFTGTLTIPAAISPSGEPTPLDVSGTMSLAEDAQGNDIFDVDFDTATEATFDAAGLPFEDFDGPFQLSGNRLTITNETTFDFDFGGPAEAEAASMLMVLARTG